MARERKKPIVKTLPKDGELALNSFDAHDKAMVAYERSLLKEQEWKQLVAEGKARCVITPVTKGYRYHYELINN